MGYYDDGAPLPEPVPWIDKRTESEKKKVEEQYEDMQRRENELEDIIRNNEMRKRKKDTKQNYEKVTKEIFVENITNINTWAKGQPEYRNAFVNQLGEKGWYKYKDLTELVGKGLIDDAIAIYNNIKYASTR